MKFFRIPLLLPLLSMLAFSQSDRGTITGSVSDPGGALIPNATVVIVNSATGVKSETQTTGTGSFTAPYLSAGVYDINIEVAGFRKFT